MPLDLKENRSREEATASSKQSLEDFCSVQFGALHSVVKGKGGNDDSEEAAGVRGEVMMATRRRQLNKKQWAWRSVLEGVVAAKINELAVVILVCDKAYVFNTGC